MANSPERAQRGAGVSGVSLGRGGTVRPNSIIDDAFARTRADELDAEAAHYSRRAVQEQQAMGPGYYVDLLLGMATDRAAMAHRLRTRNRVT